MMKKLILLYGIFLYSYFNCQIGIGTNVIDSNIILQINSSPDHNQDYKGGVLFPRVSLSSTKIFEPITGDRITGLMVYNIATSGSDSTAVFPGYYYWDDVEKSWTRMVQKSAHDTAMFSNQNSSSNINTKDAIYADIFSNIRFNNNPSLYQKVNSTTLRITEVGYYKVILNLDLASSGGGDNFGVEIVVNDSFDIVSDNMYIPGRWNNESGDEKDFPNGRSFVIYVPINVANHTLKVRTYQIDKNTDVKFKNANSSTISIEKIR